MENESLFRWVAVAIFALNMAFAVYFRRRARRSSGTIPRKAEGTPMVILRLAVAFPLYGALLAYMIHPPWMAWSAVPIPPWLRWIGAALGLVTVPLIIWTLQSIGSNVSETVLTKQEHELVTHGPYRWVRHPIYSVGSLWLIAFVLLTANAFIAVMTLLHPAAVW